MIVKNEESYIGQCINSVKDFVDEMIVVDTGSRDKTVEIAKSLGAKVFFAEWKDDFAAAKNAAVKQASCDWILVLDADEVVARGDMERLKEIIVSSNAWGFEVQQRNYTSDTNLYGWQPCDIYTECRGPGFFVSPIVRIFKNHAKVRFRYPVHEEVDSSILELGKQIVVIPFPVHHYGYLKGNGVVDKKRKEYLKIGLSICQSNPNDPKPVYEVGKIFLHEGSFAKAEEQFRKVISMDPNYKICFTNLGECLFKQGKIKEAIEAYQESIRRVPHNENAYINLGHIVFTQGMNDAACALFRRAIEINPTSAAAYNNLVLVLIKMDRLGEAVVVLEKAIGATKLDKFKQTLEKIRQKYPEEVHLQELVKRKDFTAAEMALRKRLEKDPLDILTLTNLGLVFSKSGETEKIIALFQEAVDKNPLDKSPLWINLRFNLVNAYVEMGKVDQAKEFLKKTIELNPPKVELLKNRLEEIEDS